MRKITPVVGLLVGALLLALPDGWACGDKFLVIGRGVRSQRTRGAVQHAAILAYLDGAGRLNAALRGLKLEKDLRLAGHTLRPVASAAELREEVRSGRYDILLADISEMVGLEPEVGAAPGRPFLLPMIYNATGEELAEAEGQYECVMRSPSTRKDYLAVIDEAMTQRKKQEKARRAR
jgi:hypothetical protein